MKKAFDVDRNLIFFCRDIIKCSFGGFFLIILVNLIVSIIGLANTCLMSGILDALSLGGTIQIVMNFVLLFVIMQLLKATCTFLLQYLYTKYSMEISNSIIKMIVMHLHKVSILDVKKFGSVYLAERINTDAIAITNFIISSLPSIFINITSLILLFILIFFIDFKYGLILICVCGLYIILYIIFKKDYISRCWIIEKLCPNICNQ